MTRFPSQACWRPESVPAVISNEALEGNEGIFLATHTPIRGFSVGGSHGGEIAGQDEQAVLDALANPDRRHAFCVVEGEPGSGKSHLIRWLSVNWPKGSDVKLLLQRADGSLEGALRQLRERLPPDFADLFDNLGTRQQATEQGRANTLLSNLANALRPDYFEQPLPDTAWCLTHQAWQLLDSRPVKERWGGARRILRLMEGGGAGDGGQRNSVTASFNLFDVAELAVCCSDVRGLGVDRAAQRLASRLLEEASSIVDHKRAGWTADEVEREHRTSFSTSLALMQALNLRRNHAVQHLLGVSAEGLKRLFRQVRQQLALRGQRLILLLEDITSWEGIDDSLIDVLVTNAETRGADGESDMCPLISVVGITPAYFAKLQANYRGRITHQVSLGVARSVGELQDVATLRDRMERLAFAGRYLAAVRAGPDSLAKWREGGRIGMWEPPPNRCDDCEVRDACHRSFGVINGVGFFPFTADALERFFAALDDNDNGMTWKTPRGILQAILSPTLSRPNAIAEGVYPGPWLDNRALAPESRRLSRRLDDIVSFTVEALDQDRARRLLAYWGDKERADTTLRADGEYAFAAVPRGVFDAFNLGWIGDAEPTPDQPTSTPNSSQSVQDTPTDGASGAGTPTTDTPDEPSQPPKTTPVRGTASGSRVKPPPRRGPSRPELETLRDELRVWQDGGDLASPSTWNKMLHELVRAIDPRRIGLDPYTFDRLLTAERVKVAGTAPAERGYLMVKADPWFVHGLEALLAIRLDRAPSAADTDFCHRAVAAMMLKLERETAEYVDRRLLRVAEAGRWNPVPALAQILLARAWLRGVATPTDPIPDQLRAILSDEPAAESDPRARSQPWREFLDKSKPHHQTLRSAVRKMLETPQGESRGFGLADLSAVVGAIARLGRTLNFDSLPAATADIQVQEFDVARRLIGDVKGTLRRIVQIERDQVKQRAEALQEALRGMSIAAHYTRVDKAVDAVSTQLPTAAPDEVRVWKKEYVDIKPRIDGQADRTVEDALVSVSDGDSLPTGETALLAWLVRVPVADLESMRNLAQRGDRVVEALLEHVRDCVREAGNAVPLSHIHAVGQAIRAICHHQTDPVETAAE